MGTSVSPWVKEEARLLAVLARQRSIYDSKVGRCRLTLLHPS
jgi:hypothetical protein